MDALLKGNLISTKDAADISGYTSDYLARLARSGKIIGRKIGHSWFVDKESLKHFSDQQKDRKVDYMRALVRIREAEYRAHHSSINRKVSTLSISKLPYQRFDVAKIPPRSGAFALSTAILVLVFAALMAQSAAIPQLADGMTSLARGISSGFSTTFGGVPSFIASKIDMVGPGVHGQPTDIAIRNPLSFTSVTPTAPSLGSTPTHFVSLVYTPVVSTATPFLSGENLHPLALAVYAFLTNPSLAVNAFTHTLIALGATIINTTHFAIHADVMLAYGLAEAAPESAQITVAFVGDVGDTFAGATVRVPALAAAFYLNTTSIPATLAPKVASAIFDVEYAAATRFIALTNAFTSQYLALISGTGRFVYKGTVSAFRLTDATLAFLSHVPSVAEDVYLGTIGRSALAFSSSGGENAVRTSATSAFAAAFPMLSVGEQAALLTYQTIHGLFDSVTEVLAPLLGTTSNVAIVSNPPSSVLFFSTSTVAINAPQSVANFATSSTPASPAPTFISAPRTVVTNYPTYTTIVHGVSENFVNDSLATLRASILATVAGMVQPVAAQSATNVTTIQQVNMIQDLSNLIVHNGDFRGGTFDKGNVTNGISVSATTGNFTNLTVGSLSVSGTGTTTFSGPVDASGNFFVNGVPLTISGGSGTVNSGVAGQFPYYTANGTTLTATSSLFISGPGDIGIGTTSPYALLSIGNTNGIGFTLATSTFNTTGGINLASGGCFAINGVCIGNAGSATPAGGTADVQFNNSGVFGANDGFTFGVTNGQLSIPSNGWYAIGGDLLGYASSTNQDTVFGLGAGGRNATTSSLLAQNTAFGYQSLSSNFSSSGAGDNNTAFGANTLSSNVSGSDNTANGNHALYSNTYGYWNTATGYDTLYANTTGTENTATGYGALASSTTGIYNTATGYDTLYANTTGYYNVANGSIALGANTTGYDNTANGNGALGSNTTGFNNTANGFTALASSTTGDFNTANGSDALYYDTTGSANTANGYGALQDNAIGSDNAANGGNALYNSTGNYNTADGYQSGFDLAAGSNNIALGANVDLPSNTASQQLNIGNLIYGTGVYNGSTPSSVPTGGNVGIGTTSPSYPLDVAGFINTDQYSGYKQAGNTILYASTTNESLAIGASGAATWMAATSSPNYSIAIGSGDLQLAPASAANLDSTAIGYDALAANTTGTGNTANGFRALSSNTTGTDNTVSGVNALYSNTTGTDNTANGVDALYANTTGNFNVANGMKALYSNTTGTNNVANGIDDLVNNTTGSYNTANGASVLGSNTTGNYNTANGFNALYSNTTGSFNTADGESALVFNTTGTDNTALGASALFNNTTGTGNTANGFQALSSNTIGNNNTANGMNALYWNTTGTNNTANGTNALFLNATGTDNTANGFNVLYYNTTGSYNTANGANVLGLNTTGSYDTANGFNALYHNTVGTSNVANGVDALYINTTGNDNVANGNSALYSNTTGSYNTANGNSALYSNTTGNENTANGFDSLYSNTTGYLNTANGYESLFFNATGTNNTATGQFSLYSNTTGYSNTANGSYSLYENTTGLYNTASGLFSLYSNTTGNYNTANGAYSLRFNTTGYNDAANGYDALQFNTTGNDNVANGPYSLDYNTIGNSNTAVGWASLYSNTTGNDNTANGNSALYSNTTGANNTANGSGALWNNSIGVDNTAAGYESLFSNTSNYNTAFGYETLDANTVGGNNTANGNSALYSNTTGNYNVAIGGNADYNNTSATNTVAVGYEAGYGASGHYSSVNNTLVGMQAGYNVQTGANNETAIGTNALLNDTTGGSNTAVGVDASYGISTGSYNTTLGYQSGYNLTTGSNNTLLGNFYNTTDGISTGDNNIIIGESPYAGIASTTSNQLDIGNLIYGTGLGGNGTLSTGNVGVGTTSPFATLSVAGAAGSAADLFAISTSSTNSATSTVLTVDSNGNLSLLNGAGLEAQRIDVVLYASQFGGLDAGAKINNCLSALPISGGTCDARGLTGAQSAAATIIVPANDTLLLGGVTLTLSGNPGVAYNKDSAILGLSQDTTAIIDEVSNTSVFSPQNPSVTSEYAKIENLNIAVNGATGMTGIQVTNHNFGYFENLLITASTSTEPNVGIVINPNGGSAYFNEFHNLYIWGMATGTQFINQANENKFYGGEFQGDGVGFEFGQSDHNVITAPSIEGDVVTGIQFDAQSVGNEAIAPRLEFSSTPVVINDATGYNTISDAYLGGSSKTYQDQTGTLNFSSTGTGLGSYISYDNTFGIGTSSAAFRVLGSGDVGVGTTSPYSLLSIGNTGGIGFSLATSTFDTTGGINLAGGGCYAINGVCIGVSGGGGTVTSVALTAPTGFIVSGSPITTNGTLALSLAAGYNIPLTASTTNWNDFFNTPSSQIAAGTDLAWTGNTLAFTGTQNSGTVTSVAASGGTTGLTFTGSPITTSGTLTLGGTLDVINGGTGSTTLSGILEGNGTSALTTALAGVDYLAPSSLSATAPLAYNSGTGIFSIPQANGTTNGYLSSTDWSTFALKDSFAFPFTPVSYGVSTSTTVGFTNGLLSVASSTFAAGLFVNGDLGVNNSSPAFPLDVGGVINTSQYGGYAQAGNLVLYASTTNKSLAIGASGAATWMSASSSPFYDTAIGYQSMNTTPTSNLQYNTAIGPNTLLNNTDGYYNTAIGASALQNNIDGFQNIAIGNNALNDATSSQNQNNIAIGKSSMFNNQTGSTDVAIGANSLLNNTTGYSNLALGASSLQANLSGAYNVGIGVDALNAATSTNDLTAIGALSLEQDTSGTGNTGIGFASLSHNTTGSNNTGIGTNALYANITGAGNVSIGGSLGANVSGNNNVALGSSALPANTSGSSNVAIGYATLYQDTTGGGNVALGSDALLDGNPSSAVAIGYVSQEHNAAGPNNVSVGSYTLQNNTTGQDSVAIGINALQNNDSATDTVAIGMDAGQGSAGYSSIAGTYIGYNSGANSSTGSNSNTMVGFFTGFNNTTGAYNTLLGYESGYDLSTGSNNIAIGNNVDLPSNTGNQQLNIGNLLYGTGLYNGTSMSSTPVTGGAIGIGTTSPSSLLSFAGTSGLFASTTATSTFQGGGINLITGAGNTGCYAINGTCITGGAVSSVSNSDGTLTISPTTGSVVASLNLANANSWTSLQTFSNATTTLLSASYASSTIAYFGTEYLPNLGTPAGSFLAVNSSGEVIATTTPNGAANYWILSGNNIYNNNDSGNGFVGIDTSAPAYPLDVGGVINTSQYGGYDQNGNSVLYASTTNGSLAVGASNAAVWMAATSTFFDDVAVGPAALAQAPISGNAYNTAIGANALQYNTGGFENTANGASALVSNTTGQDNSALGYAAIDQNTTGANDTANGAFALTSNTTGSTNTATGGNALYSNTTGSGNVADGFDALGYNISATSTAVLGAFAGYGTSNYFNQGGVYVGFGSGHNAATGSNYNTLLGYQSGYDLTTGANNIAIGSNVDLPSNTASQQLNIGNLIYGTGVYNGSTPSSVPTGGNVGIGTTSPSYPLDVAGFINTDQYSGYKQAGNTILYASTTNYSLAVGASGAASWMSASSSPFYDVAIGYQALNLAQTSGGAQYNIAVGYQALSGNTTGYYNTASGGVALQDNTTGYNNSAYGAGALELNTTGYNNTAIGEHALESNSTGVNNIAIGENALSVATSSSGNTAVGKSALRNDTAGIDNTASGVSALYENTTGSNNTVDGMASLYDNTTGSYNSILGYNVLNNNTTGSNNVALGYEALWENLSATSSVALGYQAGVGNSIAYSNQGGVYVGYQSGYSAATGSNYNTLLGYQSGYNLTTGANNIAIGSNVDLPSNTASQQLNIGNLIYGTGVYNGGTMSSAPTGGDVGIGTTSPAATLAVNGLLYIGGTGTSTIQNNLYVMGTLRATNSYAGDLIFRNGFRFTEGDMSAPMQTLNMENQFGSTTVTFTDKGDVGIGTTTPNNMLTVEGDIGATAFVNTSTRNAETDMSYIDASTTESMFTQLMDLKVATYRYKIENQNDPLRLGLVAEDAQTIAPEILSPDGTGIDLYKLATFTLSGVQTLATKVSAEDARVTSLEERVVALESGAVSSASGSPISFSTSSLASALNSFGVLIQKGIAQFNTLVFHQLVASTDANGVSSAGSVTVLAGNTVSQVNNPLVQPSTKVFITFNSQITGSWWVSDKTTGSFRVMFSSPQTNDVSFDYLLIQTEGQIATSTPSDVPSVSPSSGSSSAPLTITLLGDNPVHLPVGSTFVEPGVIVTDSIDGTDPYTTFINGVQQVVSSTTIDTSSPTTYIITYSVTDTAGNVVTATRAVIVGNPDGAVNVGTGSVTSGVSVVSTTTVATTTPTTPDTTPPIVTLNGAAAIQIQVGDTFIDPGATAMDSVDGNLTSKIRETGVVATTTPGIYTLTYSVTDTAGNTGTASRVVTVIAALPTASSTLSITPISVASTTDSSTTPPTQD